MQVTIEGSPKEIANLVLALQSRLKSNQFDFDGITDCLTETVQEAAQAIGDKTEIYLATILLKYRKAHHLTQEELAKALGVSKAAIGMYETGARKPDIIKLKKLAVILGCTADELLEPIQI